MTFPKLSDGNKQTQAHLLACFNLESLELLGIGHLHHTEFFAPTFKRGY